MLVDRLHRPEDVEFGRPDEMNIRPNYRILLEAGRRRCEGQVVWAYRKKGLKQILVKPIQLLSNTK
jgi:hypothetical protein